MTTQPILAITRPLPASVEERASRHYTIRRADAPMEPDALLQLARDADAILCTPSDKMDAAIIARLPASVKVLGTFSVGFDHIDIAACRARGLKVVHTPDVLSVATAECALLLILAAARRAGEGERMLRAGQWKGWTPTQLVGTLVSGRRLGIFGMGRIGRELARMAAGLNMQIHYRNNNRLPPDLEAGAIHHADDASFLAECDVLSLNAPGGANTKQWLNAERIAMLPEGAIVVNTARGTLVDDAALIAALRSGRVRCAGLDVYTQEPIVDPGYLSLENVVLLPHMGSATDETRQAMGNLVLDGIDSVLAGRDPDNLIA